jgi:hypothetical protein
MTKFAMPCSGLALIGNDRAAGLLASAFPRCAEMTPNLGRHQPVSRYRLFSATAGPSNPVSWGGSFLAGVVFQVTTGGVWFDGYWWWVCDAAQPTAAQKFALWALYANGNGALVPGATTTSGALTAGRWNFVPVPAPVPLSIGACYNACTGFTGSFPTTNNQFGAGDQYAAGITAGPLSAFSDQSGQMPAPFSMPQGTFSAAGSDPSAIMPADGYSSANFWMDVQVSDVAPAGASYRLWPGYPTIPPTSNGDNLEQTFGTEFRLSQDCALNNIWFYSPPAVSPAALPAICAIWNVRNQQVVPGTQNNSPAWSGTAGSGWVACPYPGVTLPAGDYKVTVFTTGGSTDFYQETEEYWGAGPGAGGIVSGPLSAPGVAGATAPGQTTYHHGGFGYPDTYDTEFNGQNRWVDVEVTPSAAANPSPTADSGAFLTFFP